MGSLRVIAGTARGKRLRSVPGNITRPITDRGKEALFNILAPDLGDATFLDLFAGTGSVGIEALSRGGAYARFIDKHPKAISTVHANLKSTGLADKAEVKRMDAFSLLKDDPQRAFDYIFIAPPQYKDMWSRALKELDANLGWLSADGWVIVQIHPVEFEPVALDNLVEFDQRRYGSVLFIFYERCETRSSET
jgi:16S rRNA (guanine(966)-N(2))-methyltransferase RsmD